MTNAPAMNRSLSQQIRSLPARTDIFLLIFLLFFTVDSVVMKPVALAGAIIILWRHRAKLKFKDAPLFYLLIPAMEILRFIFFNKDFSAGHWATALIGVSYWLMAYAAFLIVRYRAEINGGYKMAGTLTTWFYINVGYSIWQLVMTMVHAHSWNPYNSADILYGNSTGDYIKGIMLAPCYLNMFVNSFFTVWFLYQKKWGRALLATFICCLTTTNFANIIFLPVLLLLVFVLKEKMARLTTLACVGMFVLFSVFISSGNLAYLRASMSNTAGKISSRPISLSDTASHLPRKDSPRPSRLNIGAIYERLARPNGKVLSWKETWAYATAAPAHALAGAGIGNFSSLLALHMAHIYGRRHSRFYELMPVYIHPAYRANHYQIMNDVYALPEGYHSARHMPHSFPNQLIGEYGLIGVLFFVFGYVWYFLKRGIGRGHFLIIMLLTGVYLWFDYLFEYLSVMVIFELFFWQYRAEVTKAHTNA